MQLEGFTRADMNALMTQKKNPCVSIFLPTHRVTMESQQDQIRYKNLLRKAEDKLKALGFEDLEKMMEPAKSILKDTAFWAHQGDGLAVFIANDLFRRYRVPIPLEELVCVSDRFVMKPLFPLVTGNGQFFLLALSEKIVRLFESTRYDVREIELEDMPTSIEEALQYEAPEKRVQFHTRAPMGAGPVGTGDRSAVFHGQGMKKDDEKDQIVEYLRIINQGISSHLAQREHPLIVACVDRLFSMFKSANTYPHLVEKNISGNPDVASGDSLREKAWPLVEPHFLTGRKQAMERYEQLGDRNRTSQEIREILSAAVQGRVETLFAASTAHLWGYFNPDDAQVDMHQSEQPGDQDLLDVAAVEVLQRGGNVYILDPSETPGGGSVAALFRF